MMEELTALFGSIEFENSGGLSVASARWPGRACELLLDVRTGDEKDPRQVHSLTRSSPLSAARPMHAS